MFGVMDLVWFRVSYCGLSFHVQYFGVQCSVFGYSVYGFWILFQGSFLCFCLGSCFGYLFSSFRGSGFSFGVWPLCLGSGFTFGFRVWSTESRSLGLGVWVSGLCLSFWLSAFFGFEVHRSGVQVEGFWVRVRSCVSWVMVWFKVCFLVWNLALSSGFRFLFRFLGTGFMSLRLGVWVYGFGFRVHGSEYKCSLLRVSGNSCSNLCLWVWDHGFRFSFSVLSRFVLSIQGAGGIGLGLGFKG